MISLEKIKSMLPGISWTAEAEAVAQEYISTYTALNDEMYNEISTLVLDQITAYQVCSGVLDALVSSGYNAEDSKLSRMYEEKANKLLQKFLCSKAGFVIYD